MYGTDNPASAATDAIVRPAATRRFLRPALQATIPLIVPDPHRRASANALLAVSHSVLRIGAPLAGTALPAANRFAVVVAIDAAPAAVALCGATAAPVVLSTAILIAAALTAVLLQPTARTTAHRKTPH